MNDMTKPNFENRTLFHGDNLDIMRGINSETIDLIATDPPFNKGKDFHYNPESLDSGARFQDRWSWERDVHETWADQIADDYPKLMEAIESARYAHSDAMGAYMCFMAVRLLEMRRILKQTGSIYLHCDPTASHYLKAAMDAIFGHKNFVNEIVWCYKDVGGGRNTDYYKRKHDIIFWYAKDTKKKKTCELARGSLSDSTIDRFGSLFDNNGIITYRKLKDQRPREFASRKAQGRVPENLDEIFLSKTRGRLREDHWHDINPIRKRRRGDDPKEPYRYPTQKPISLYARLIDTTTEKDDVVLDPFCGCATTCVAAERQGRQWVGIDIWDRAHEVVLDRIKEEGLKQEGEDAFTLFSEDFHYIKDIPVRDDDGVVTGKRLSAIWVAPKETWQKLTNNQMKARLVEWQKDDNSEEVVCSGCGRILEKEFMEIDHIQPRSGSGSNFIDNRILLCRPCNGKKE